MTRKATTRIEMVNELGMHARAATAWVKLASRFESELRVIKDGREVNGKSIMGMLLLAASKGTEIEVWAVGDDCEELIEAISGLVADRFGEHR